MTKLVDLIVLFHGGEQRQALITNHSTKVQQLLTGGGPTILDGIPGSS
jgi:hypothetical protein